MNHHPNEDPQSAAVEQLERFGLTGYAAQTFVALTSLGTGTAREVSQVSNVPRTQVYDATGELRDLGLVSVEQSSPRRFRPVSAESASRSFQREFERATAVLRTTLHDLEPGQRHIQTVRTITGRSAVTRRIRECFADAETEIVYATADGLLTGALIDDLREAASHGVSIELVGVSSGVHERVRNAVPGVTVGESPWWLGSSEGRFTLVDGRTALVSAVVDGSETAIWGDGDANGLVAVVKATFAARSDAE